MKSVSQRSDGASPASVKIHRCENSHAFFYPHETCPFCGALTSAADTRPSAILLCHTTVRVSPAGSPFKLGIARVECGAQTLCIVDDDGESEIGPGSEVTLAERDGLYHATRKITG